MVIGWNGETIPALSLEHEIDIVALAGYGGLELFVPKLGPFLEHLSAQDLATRLREKNLAPLALNGIENINLRPPEEFAQVKSECVWLSQLAQAIACPVIVVVPSPKPQAMTWPEVKAQTAEELQQLSHAAAPYGVSLAFEFLAPAACSVRTLARAWEIVEAAGCANLGLVIDTYHFHVGGSSWQSLDEFEIGRLLLAHINDVPDRPLDTLTDYDRLLPGEGVLPVKRILERLSNRGYRGACSLEVMRPAYRQREPLEYARAGREACERVLAFSLPA